MGNKSGPKPKPDEDRHVDGVLVRFRKKDGEELRRRAAAERMTLSQYVRWLVCRTLT